jgi:sterol desaturase/sphingolipid hydroxylase (fatty acid hydroxylase superfamily)
MRTIFATCRSALPTIAVAVLPLLLLFVCLEISQRTQAPVSVFTQALSAGNPIFRAVIANAIGFVFVVAPLAAMEQLFPNARPSWRSYALGLAGASVGWIIGYGAGLMGQALIAILGVKPLFVVHTSHYGIALAIILIFIQMFVFDFFYYWFHRMQHTVPVLWRFHAVHHSIKNLNASMCFHHPLEDMLRILPITLPLTFLVSFVDAPVIPFVSAFISCWGVFIHTDTRVNLGPARVIFGDNEYHRVHHSERADHHNKNYAAYFSVWDRLFGTQHMPVRGERLAVGLTERPHGMSIRDFFLGISSPSASQALAGELKHETGTTSGHLTDKQVLAR